MNKTPSTLAVALSLLLPSLSCAALPELNFNGKTFQELSKTVADDHYDRVKKEAKQALEHLKDLREGAKHAREHAEDLCNKMKDNKYEAWCNTKVSPLIGSAKTLEDSVRAEYSQEDRRVHDNLNKAKSGNFEAIHADIKDINEFYNTNEPTLDKVTGDFAEVKGAYQHDFDNAQVAVVAFRQLPIVAQLLANKPKLVEKTIHESDPNHPLQRRIVLVKKDPKYNDPRFDKVPPTVTILDGQQQVVLPVTIR